MSDEDIYDDDRFGSDHDEDYDPFNDPDNWDEIDEQINEHE